MYCGTFRNIHGLYPLDASSNAPTVLPTKNVFICSQMPPGGENYPQWKTTHLTESSQIIVMASLKAITHRRQKIWRYRLMVNLKGQM